MKPLYIAFEGINNAGKTVQLRRLSETLVALNYTPIQLYEPTRGIWGTRAKTLVELDDPTNLKEQSRLFHKDRIQHVSYKVRPLLDMLETLRPLVGFRILQDRTYYSAPAFQGGGPEEIEAILEFERSIAPTPERIIYLDIDVDIALQRRKLALTEEQLHLWRERLIRARKQYLTMVDMEPDLFIKIDASLPEVVVAGKVIEALSPSAFLPPDEA